MRLRRLGLRDLDPDVAPPPELGDRRLGSSSGLPWKPFSSSTAATPLPLTVRATTTVGFPLVATRLGECAVDRLDVVAVDDDRVPAERPRTRDVDVEVPADHRLAALAQPVDVDDRGQVVELVVRGVLERLPHRALGHLAVAAQHPDAVRDAIEPLAGERRPDADREALAERAGGDVDPREDGRRVPLEPASELAVRRGAPRPRSRPRRGRSRRASVDAWPFEKIDRSLRRALRRVEVVAEVAVDEHRHSSAADIAEVGCPDFAAGAHADGVDAELLSQLAPALGVGPSGHSTAGFPLACAAVTWRMWLGADCTSSRSTA